MYLPTTSQNTSQGSLYLGPQKSASAPSTMINVSQILVAEIARLGMVQLLLNIPAIKLASIKAIIAEAAMATATAMRKSNSSTTMMFFSMPRSR
jgi:hypothetical protein